MTDLQAPCLLCGGRPPRKGRRSTKLILMIWLTFVYDTMPIPFYVSDTCRYGRRRWAHLGSHSQDSNTVRLTTPKLRVRETLSRGCAPPLIHTCPRQSRRAFVSINRGISPHPLSSTWRSILQSPSRNLKYFSLLGLSMYDWAGNRSRLAPLANQRPWCPT